MIFKGTDTDAFERASSGKTEGARRRLYKKYKKQNDKKREREANSRNERIVPRAPYFPKQQAVAKLPAASITTYRRPTNYVERKTILDDIRDYRSSKIVSNVANSLATFIIRCGGRQWDNDTRNFVRSSIALAISEVANKTFEKPLQIVDNIKLFIKVGKIIYKVVTWIDKVTNLLVTNDMSICIVKDNDFEYLSYIRKYPRLAESINSSNGRTSNMKYKIGDIVLLNNGQTVKIIMINFVDKTYCAVSTTEVKKEYIIKDADVLKKCN